MLDGAILDGTILNKNNRLNPSQGHAVEPQNLFRDSELGSTANADFALRGAGEIAAGLVRASAVEDAASAPMAGSIAGTFIGSSLPSDRPSRFLTPARITGGITESRAVSDLVDASTEKTLSRQVSFEIHHWGVGIAELTPPTHADPTIQPLPESTELSAPNAALNHAADPMAADPTAAAPTAAAPTAADPTVAVAPLPATPVPEAPFFRESLRSDSTASNTGAASEARPDALSQPDSIAPPSPPNHEDAVPAAFGRDHAPSIARSNASSNAPSGTELTPAPTQPWTPHNTWLIIHGWNSAPEIFEPTAEAITRARDGQDTVLLLDWREAAQNGGDGLGGLQSGGNFKAASWISSVADWAAQELKTWGISDAHAQTHLNLVGHSLGAFLSAEIADRFDGGVNSIFALDPASELNSVTGFGYDFDNDGETERPTRFDAVSRISRSFVGARSTAGNQMVSGWAHESYEMDFGLNLLRPPGSEHGWVYEAFAKLVDDDNAIANQIGVKNLDLISGWQKDGHRRRHEGRLVIDDRSREVERFVVASAEQGQDEIVYGTQRGDNLFGGWGRDRLLGGAGRDRLQGGQGGDVLVGGTGRDELWGGGGQDRFDFSHSDVSATIAEADIIRDFTVGGRFRSAETIGLGAGLTVEEIALETGMGEYAGDTLIRHGDKFLARLVGVGVGEVSIAKNFIQLP